MHFMVPPDCTEITRLLDPTSGPSTLNEDRIAERGARTPPHGAHYAPWGPRPKRRDDRASGPPPCVLRTVGWQYREYLSEGQRSQPRGSPRGSRGGADEGGRAL